MYNGRYSNLRISQLIKVLNMTIANFTDLTNWIETNCPQKDDHKTKTTEERALWALACQQASAVFNSYTTKELAEVFAKGVPAITVDSFNQEAQNAKDEEWLDIFSNSLVEYLNTHFGM